VRQCPSKETWNTTNLADMTKAELNALLATPLSASKLRGTSHVGFFGNLPRLMGAVPAPDR